MLLVGPDDPFPRGRDIPVERLENLSAAGGLWRGVSLAAGRVESNSGVASTFTSQSGMSARWLAFQPIVWDFGWACQSSLSSGTRSSTLRVFAISWSNSGRSVSA